MDSGGGAGDQSRALANPDVILNELPLLDQDADFVVADGPGSLTETSRALLLRADLGIVPCKASMLEVRALAKATEVLRQAQDIRGGVPKAVIVLSMVGKNYRLTQDMKDAAVALDLPLASKAMILRQIYADAPGRAVVWNLGSRASEAAQEINQLFHEILPDACRRKAKNAASAVTRRIVCHNAAHSPQVRKLRVDPNKEKEFVYGPKAEAKPESSASPAADEKPPAVIAPARVR